MLYFILYQILFKQYGSDPDSPYFYKVLNVIQYVTFRTAIAAITSLLLSLFLGRKVIRKLADLKFGQEIREEGPASHQEKKGTPTMGGVLIIGSVFISTVLWARLDSLYLWLALGALLLTAAVGFADDYIKIVKKRSLGLTGKQKLAGQLIRSSGLGALVQGELSLEFEYSFKDTALPFGSSVIPAGVYLLFMIFVLLGSSNAVNLTDGS